MPLSFAQERLWFLEQLEPGTSAYNVPLAFRLLGDLDEAALRRALDVLVTRHAVLRTTYGAAEGVPYQVVHAPRPVSIDMVDLGCRPVEARESECQTLLLDAARTPFDLAAGPVLRLMLIRLEEQESVLLWVLHHIATDGWSNEILMRELSQLYNAHVRDEKAVLPGLPIRYADYVLRQQHRLQGERLEKGIEYWTRKLKDLPPTLNLPTDHARYALPEYGAARIPVRLPQVLTTRLKRLAIEERVTPFMVLLAGWMAVLSRYANEQDIAIGTPVAGRLDADAEQIVGLFVNTLVLRADLSGNPTFREALRKVRETCLGAYDWQDVPFEKLVAELQPERQRSQSPLFQVMFVFDAMPEATLSLDGIVLQPISIDSGIAKFHLRLRLSERSGTIDGSLDYRTHLFDGWRIEQLSRHFFTLLEAAVESPDTAINEICLLTYDEARDLKRMQTGPRLPVSSLCLHQAFEKQASLTPGSEAVRFEASCLTYKELDDKADRLAHSLRRCGVANGDLVGLYVDPAVDAVIGILGILKAGAAYVPLDPSYPAKRLSYMIHDADVRALVTHSRFFGMLSDYGRPVLDLDSEGTPTTEQWASKRSLRGTPSDLAYVLYTSGSTGKPKGVAVEHRSVMNYVSSMREWLSLSREASFSWIQPLSTDTSVTTLFGALLSGGCIHVIPRERVVDSDYLTEYGREHRIDVLKIAPTHLAALLQVPRDPVAILPRCCLILGGEPLPWSLVERVREISPHVRVFNHYGPTEATVGATIFPADLEHAIRHGPTVPIGRPLHNVKAYVLDKSMQVCPLGVPGELWLGGDCLARGYVNKKEMTTSRFVTSPFAAEPGERIYRSGDLVVLHPDGNLAFLARTDNQVKIRGFRVEPGEAQSVLLTLPDVADAAVVPRRGSEGDTQLAAYVVPQGECALNTDELRDILSQHLPSPLIPSDFVVVHTLPQTAHGKLDIGALPDPDEMPLDSETENILPVGEVELRLAAVLKPLLGRRRIGRHDSFFDLGGHSLLAMRFIARIEEALNVHVPIRILFDQPTIAELASFIDNVSTEEKNI